MPRGSNIAPPEQLEQFHYMRPQSAPAALGDAEAGRNLSTVRQICVGPYFFHIGL